VSFKKDPVYKCLVCHEKKDQGLRELIKEGGRYNGLHQRDAGMPLGPQILRYVKGLSHEMDFVFDDMHGLGLNRGRGQFLNCLGAPMIL
jgi:hypothetical protein